MAKPFTKLTPQLLISEKHKFHLSNNSAIYQRYCHLIDCIAVDKGWELDKVAWTHLDGRRFIGLVEQEQGMTLGEARKCEAGWDIVCFYEIQGSFSAVLKASDLAIYRCVRYFYINRIEGWKANVDHDSTDCEKALIWYSKQVK